MFLTANPQMPHGVKAEFAPYPQETVIGGYDRLNLVPTKRADVISKPNNAPYFCPNGRPTGKQTYPWRAVLVVTHDTQLANNDMMQRLAPECRIADTSWIKPGKVAWDWWNTCNLTGVDFKAGRIRPPIRNTSTLPPKTSWSISSSTKVGAERNH